jgi:nucleoside-diphosphate-sugar epimerase
MNLLVTGGSGAIGTFVARELRDADHDVTVFDIEPPEIDGVAYVEGDVTDADAVAEAVSAADAVVHLAALLPDACERDPPRAEAVNVGGTLNVFEAAHDRGTRVVYASSKAALGTPTGVHTHPVYEPIGEDAPRSPTNLYGVTKASIERYAAAYRADGMDVAALRFASTYGPGKGQAHGDLALLPNAIRRAAAGDRVRLTGADQRNDLLYYGDIARGVAAAVETDELTHAVYHIGSGEAVSIRTFAEALREQTDAPIEAEGGLNYRDADEPSYCRLDISRARADLGYEPAYPIERGVRDFLKRLSRE